MKNINRPEYDVNQIASFITENVDEINMPGQVRPEQQPEQQPGASMQTGQGLGSPRQYYGNFEYTFEEFEKDGVLYSGTLVVDTKVEGDYDEDGGESHTVEFDDFKGINNFQRQDPETGEYIDIITTSMEGKDLMDKVGMSIIHEQPINPSGTTAFDDALRDSHEADDGHNDRSPNDYMD